MFLQESIAQRIQVRASDSVTAIRVFHETELLVQIDEFVEQTLRALKMHVVITRAMDDQEFPLQAAREGDGRTVLVALRVPIRQTHVTLLVNGIVKGLIGDRRARDG